MKHNHENKMLFWTAVFSTLVSICVIVLGICYGSKLKKKDISNKEPVVSEKAETNGEYSICEQYWLYHLETTNNVESAEND